MARSAQYLICTQAARVTPDQIQLLQKVGEGTFAEVYRGVCCGQVVAIKKWRSALPSEKALLDVLREIEIGGYAFRFCVVKCS